MENSEKKNLPPPYLSWKTFSSYIKSLRETLPPRIDKSVMRSLSGSNQNLMMNALFYLKLIRSDGTPEDLFKKIVDASDSATKETYQELLSTMLHSAYPFIFDGSDSFDLSSSTSAQFDQKFKGLGVVNGDTIQKCKSFFIGAAEEAGLKLSPHIVETRKRASRKNITSRQRIAKTDKGISAENKGENNSARAFSDNEQISGWINKFKPVFDKLPSDENPFWTIAERNKWLAALSALLDLYIEVDDGGN